MNKKHLFANCRPLFPHGLPALLIVLVGIGCSYPARAQAPPASPAPGRAAPDASPAPGPPPVSPAPDGSQALPATSPVPGAPPATPPGPASSPPSQAGPPTIPFLNYEADQLDTLDEGTGAFSAHGNVVVRFMDIQITADRVEGNYNEEIVFSGNAKIRSRGQSTSADAIHVFPRKRSYRLDTPRGILSPDFLQNRLLDPVFLSGGDLNGTTTGYTLGDRLKLTTCIEPEPHYELRVGSAELFPHKRLILRHVGVVFFGHKLFVIPYIVVPLDEHPRRIHTDYLPDIGQNSIEGYYGRFPYEFAISAAAAAFLRLDATQKQGEGYRTEVGYLAGKQSSVFNTSDAGYAGGFTGSATGTIATAYGYGPADSRLPHLGTGLGPQSGGLFAMQGYFKDGFDRNFDASFRHQQGIGGGNRFGLTTELQRNSAFSFGSSTNQTTQFNFDHSDTAHGSLANLAINMTNNTSTNTSSDALNASLRQSFDFASHDVTRNSLSYNFTYANSTYSSTFAASPGGAATASESATQRLDSQFQFQHASREYSFGVQANKLTNLAAQTGSSTFGALERLPELQFSADTIRFKGGLLHQLPLHFDLGVGEYSEPGHTRGDLQSDRVLMGLTMQDIELVSGKTEVTSGGGFEQRVYGDGAAQFIVRNVSRLRQHLGGRSGFDINYTYSQPEGGTPFFFDTFGRQHNITAEGGYLDDRRFQLTAQVGYDLQGSASQFPWQSVSSRVMWRPTPSVRFDGLCTYDPNTTRFLTVSNSVRVRSRNDFAIDLQTQYDPSIHKFSQINGQFDIPLGRTWRIAGLLRYNGILRNFESQNLQVTHDWDCLQASITYSRNPYSFANPQQLFFMLRIKAFPFFRSFARGPAGQSLSAGLGSFN